MAASYTLYLHPNIRTNDSRFKNIPLGKVVLFVGRVEGLDIEVRNTPLNVPSHIMEKLEEDKTVQLAEYVNKGLAVVEVIDGGPAVILTPDEVFHISYNDVRIVAPLPLPTI